MPRPVDARFREGDGREGTAAVADAVTDALVDSVEFHGGVAHAGIVEAGQNLAERYAAVISRFEARAPGKARVYAVGHSLGAGAAAAAAMELRTSGASSSIKAVGFGTPGFVSLETAHAVKPFVTSVVHGSDVIPRLSESSLLELHLRVANVDLAAQAVSDIRRTLTSLAAVPAAAHLFSRLPRSADMENNVDGFVELVGGFLRRADEAKRGEAYAALLADLKTRAATAPRLYVPGQVVHVVPHRVDDHASPAASASASASSFAFPPAPLSVAYVDPENVELQLTRWLFVDHLAINYRASLHAAMLAATGANVADGAAPFPVLDARAKQRAIINALKSNVADTLSSVASRVATKFHTRRAAVVAKHTQRASLVRERHEKLLTDAFERVRADCERAERVFRDKWASPSTSSSSPSNK